VLSQPWCWSFFLITKKKQVFGYLAKYAPQNYSFWVCFLFWGLLRVVSCFDAKRAIQKNTVLIIQQPLIVQMRITLPPIPIYQKKTGSSWIEINFIEPFRTFILRALYRFY